ncbi:hypothetical protein Tco_0922942 [Tanacetum coccineum]|uniref:Uncharacterized protein n=1 Tax=Tanacetum coccineum TaxID=301880 RepID=A0ABQ5D1Z7_9ASTR
MFRNASWDAVYSAGFQQRTSKLDFGNENGYSYLFSSIFCQFLWGACARYLAFTCAGDWYGTDFLFYTAFLVFHCVGDGDPKTTSDVHPMRYKWNALRHLFSLARISGPAAKWFPH